MAESTLDHHKAQALPSLPKLRALRRASADMSAGVILTLIVVAALVIWETVSRLQIINPMFISRPTDIATAIPELYRSSRVRDAVAETAVTMAKAFAYGTGAGIILGYALGFSRLLRDAFYGPALFLLSVPKSIFIPMFMAFFGINATTAVYYGAFSCVIYVLVNVVGGFDLIEKKHLMVARAYGAKLHHRALDVVFPGSLPGVFTGIWYGMKNALQGVLILELFVSVGGLGSAIRFYTNALRVDMVFGIVLGISLTAILAGSAWSRVENRLSRWRPSSEVGTVSR